VSGAHPADPRSAAGTSSAASAAAQPRSREHAYPVNVQFGDCDPAGIVFFPNFNRWMDEASLAFFMACGIPPWRELVKARGIIGTPLLEIHTRFLQPATYGETITIHTTVEHWAAKTFRQRHVVRRGDTVLCEGTEVRAFCIRDPGPPERLRAIPVPEDIRAACTLPD
jgi:4-hydroxybenzoyl-CoA thioesterase